MSEAHFLLRWTTRDGQQDEHVATSEQAAETAIQNLLLDGVHPSRIALYRSVDWNFEIAAHIKPGNAPEGRPLKP